MTQEMNTGNNSQYFTTQLVVIAALNQIAYKDVEQRNSRHGATVQSEMLIVWFDQIFFKLMLYKNVHVLHVNQNCLNEKNIGIMDCPI